MPFAVTDPIMSLKGIGEKNAALFQKLHIETIGQLLSHFPRDYRLMPQPVTIREALASGQKVCSCAILATITTRATLKSYGGRTQLSFMARDGFGSQMQVSYFNMPYMRSKIRQGDRRVFYGQLTDKGGRLFMTQPKMMSEAEYGSLVGSLIPVYPKTKGLSDQLISKYMKMALDGIAGYGSNQRTAHDSGQNSELEYIPGDICQKRELMPLVSAYRQIHFPDSLQDMQKARARFSYEEFLLFLLSVKMQKAGKTESDKQIAASPEADRLMENLPYQLTGSQKKAVTAIRKDLSSGYCMNRLLQGDVGSGKTIVAIIALLDCAAAGYQGALMAPTEVLARQHFQQIEELTEKWGLPLRPALLVGSTKASEKKKIYRQLKEGQINLVIGTHALIQDPVEFQNLALAVIDEQHRFGVKQRDVLHEKGGGNVHTIVMSATPIPRSLAIVLYGQLDISEMTDMPGGRLPIKNCVVDQSWRPSAYKFMNEQIAAGRQIYVICPMAEPGVMEELENVGDYAKSLKAYFPENVNIEYLHGKMRPKQKNEIMERFAEGQTQILVSTTVIEVGVNVPNATVMLVENAERFGLASLHQIRGRVGRSDIQSYCIFMETQSRGQKNERLDILNRSNDGFEIAQKDLELRGPGDLTGLEQSGAFSFRHADIYRDHSYLMDASADADAILMTDPALQRPEHALLKEYLDRYAEESYMDVL